MLGGLLFLLGLISALGKLILFAPYSSISLSAGAGWMVGGFLMHNSEKFKRKLGAVFLFGGSLVALTILMASPLWLWELNESWSVTPVAKMVLNERVRGVVIDGNEERPSLNWYAAQRILNLNESPNAKWVLTRNPTRVIDMAVNHDRQCKSTDKEGKWTLLLCSPKHR